LIDAEKKWYDRFVRDVEQTETPLKETMATRVQQLNEMVAQFNFLDRVNPKFAFLPSEGAISWEELAVYLRQPLNVIKANDLFCALQRGLAAHHAGLDKRYRQTVERLFRMKKIQVVFATGTLAVGINMPCKTTVFAGHSPYLNTMNYRQMSGRAGRRGFDTIGNVVFYCTPRDKVNQLLTSKLSDLRGNLPMNISLALRLLCRYSMWDDRCGSALSAGQNKVETQRAAHTITHISFFGHGNPHYPLTVPFYLYYSVGYLVKEKYIGVDGTPGDCCGLLNHLYFLEPTNYAFVSLLRAGLFDSLLGKENSKKDLTLELLVILCNLFCKLKLPRLLKITAANKGPSSVILEPLPTHFQKAIQDHNLRALNTAIIYLKGFAKVYQKELGEDNILPISNVVFPSVSNEAVSSNTLLPMLKSASMKYQLRSAFSATSGKGDHFETVAELTNSLRRGVILDRALVPILELDDGPFNAYIYDLFNHKSPKSLIRYNYIRKDTLYDNLKHFMLILKTISVALTKRSQPVNSKVAGEFTQLSNEFSELFENFAHKF